MSSVSTPRRVFKIDGPSELVIGNFFGTNASGANLGNAVGGACPTTGSNTIGGTSAGAANVFGFNTTGLQIDGANEVVIGNLFGTNASGANVGNVVGVARQRRTTRSEGARPAQPMSSVSTRTRPSDRRPERCGHREPLRHQLQAARIWATPSVCSSIRGATRSAELRPARPMSSASTPRRAFRSPAANELVIGNFFGINSSGDNLGNAVGVVIGSGGNTIGGTALGDRNIISFNNTAGVQITGTGASGNVLIGNLSAPIPRGQVALGNDIGVLISGGSANVIGGRRRGRQRHLRQLHRRDRAHRQLGQRDADPGQPDRHRPVRHACQSSARIEPALTALQNAGIAIIGSVGNTVGGTGQAANVISGNYVGVNLANIAAGAGQQPGGRET